ncbi:MAG: AI-2E family transporter [Gammaproteobacteria bacterium]|nr:AI-2E family transporter [Gammaproteobacteria bacterium]
MLRIFNDLYKRYFSEEEALIFTILIIVGIIVMMTMGGVIAPLLWSLVLSFILQGLVNSLVRLNLSYRLSVYLTYLFFISLMLLIILILLPFTWARLGLFIDELPNMMSQLRTFMLLLPENYPDLFTETQIQSWINSLQNALGQMGQSVLSYSVSSITRLVTILVYTILVPVMVFFMLKDADKLLNWLENWLPEKRPIMAQIWQEMNGQLANYIRGKALEIVIVALSSYVVFTMFGLNYPVLLAFMTGFSVIIPYVGATFVTIPVFLVALFQWGFSSDLNFLLFAYVVIQILDGNLLVPLIFSETVKLHPLAIITAILFFGGIWGFLGVFFAIPLATFIKAIIRAWPVPENINDQVQE